MITTITPNCPWLYPIVSMTPITVFYVIVWSLPTTAHHCPLLHKTAYDCPQITTSAHHYPLLHKTVHDGPQLTTSAHHCPLLPKTAHYSEDCPLLHKTAHYGPRDCPPIAQDCPCLRPILPMTVWLHTAAHSCLVLPKWNHKQKLYTKGRLLVLSANVRLGFEATDINKHSSLLQHGFNYSRKKFNSTGPSTEH